LLKKVADQKRHCEEKYPLQRRAASKIRGHENTQLSKFFYIITRALPFVKRI
jgi:hypothetical protein